jgi:hypothetical protein
MAITVEFIRQEIRNQQYEISLHADDERLAEGLSMREVESALLRCEILENYPDDPRGESCLALGFATDQNPVHIVCGRNRSGHLILITVYIPRLPKWKDPYTRNY